MNLTEAIERVRKEKLDWCETIYATSDGHFFLNSTPEHILKHAEDNSLDIFPIKGPELEKSEPIKKEPKPLKEKNNAQ